MIPHGMHALRRGASTALAITEVSLWKNECIYPNCKFPTADWIFATKLIRNVNLTDPMLKSRGSNHTTLFIILKIKIIMYDILIIDSIRY